jgi:thiol-disulfide isomerase/thioredoxin
MSLSKSRIALLALGAIVTVALGTTYRGALRKGSVKVTEPPPAAAAKPAPSPVALKDGATRDLSAPSGKLLVVHFWATWCAPCEEELPGLVAWWREAKADPRIELVAVSVDEEWKVVDGFLAKRGAADLPLALDPKKSAASAFGTEKFPETWFLSPDGEVLLHQVGAQDWSSPAARSVLQALVAKAFGPGPAAS